MTDPRPFFDRREPAPPSPKPPPLSPTMYADRDGTCRDCHTRPVVPYNPRCQGCAVRVATRGARADGG